MEMAFKIFQTRWELLTVPIPHTATAVTYSTWPVLQKDAAETYVNKLVPNQDKLLYTVVVDSKCVSGVTSEIYISGRTLDRSRGRLVCESQDQNFHSVPVTGASWALLNICIVGEEGFFTSEQTSLLPLDGSIHDSIYAVSTLLVTQKQIKSIPGASNKVMITLWLWHLRQPLAKSAQNSLLTLFITSHNDPIQRQRGPASAQGPGNNPLH